MSDKSGFRSAESRQRYLADVVHDVPTEFGAGGVSGRTPVMTSSASLRLLGRGGVDVDYRHVGCAKPQLCDLVRSRLAVCRAP
jgi:hypothetical protein